MANWAKFQEDTVGKRVIKRARYSIHFDNGNGSITGMFSGTPVHYQDAQGVWQPIDTKLLLGADGYYGCPHSPVRVHQDGHVKVDGTDYAQYIELPSASLGLVNEDKIVRTFSFGEQRLWVTEDGFKSEIIINRVPTLAEAKKLIATESGTLSLSYLKSLTTAVDANGNTHEVTTLAKFRTWLASAVYPVVIDPDFASGASFGNAYGVDATYATARSTASAVGTITYMSIGQRKPASYYVYRGYIKFDTSAIGAGGTVNQNNLRMVCRTDTSTTDFDVQIVKYNWSSQDPLTTGNMEAAYDGCLAATADDNIWRGTSGISTNTQYTSGNLAVAWVNKAGTTYYGLRSSRDAAATQPSGSEYINIQGPDNADANYRPCLIVDYTAGATPDELTASDVEAASSVSASTLAQLHALTDKDVESASSVSKPTLEVPAGTVDLTSKPVTALPTVSKSVVAQTQALTSKAVTSASSVTKSVIAQIQALTSKPVTSDSSVTKSVIAGNHALTSKNVTSASSVSKSTIAHGYTLTAINVESASSASKPVVTQVHALTSKSVTAESSVSESAMSESAITVDLTGKNVTVASTVSMPTLAQTQALVSQSVTAASEVSKSSLSQSHALISQNVTSASSVSQPTLAQSLFALVGKNVAMASEVSKPTIGQGHKLTSQNVTSVLSVENPSAIPEFEFAEYWDGTVKLITAVNGNVILNQIIDNGVVIESTSVATTQQYWGGGYWGASYWGKTYWGASGVGVIEILERLVKLNREINNGAIMNREINQPNYAELEAI